jgi:hypothetical protein
MKDPRKKIFGCFFIFLGFFVLIQFVPVRWPQPTEGQDIPAPMKVRAILKEHCYSCHSSRAQQPWYANLAPLSWWLSYDVNQGVSRLDFSRWESESTASAGYKIAHSGHRLRKGDPEIGDALMPPASYLWFHPQDKLSPSEIEVLLDWASEHGINLDGSDQRLRLHPPRTSKKEWPYLIAAESLKADSGSNLDGPISRSVKLRPVAIHEFDPGGSSHEARGGTLVGLNRYNGTYRMASRLDQALLYVDGDVDCSLEGRGALVARGDVRLDLAGASNVLVLVGGNITVTGGGTDCSLTVVSGGLANATDLTASGSWLCKSLEVKNSNLTYDPEMTGGSIPLGPARRTVLNYCDRDGELAEMDRRMEVLYDADVFTLHDPEYEITSQAIGPQSALEESQKILSIDPAMNEANWKRSRFQKKWLSSFETLPSDESLQAHLEYSLSEWAASEVFSPPAGNLDR